MRFDSIVVRSVEGERRFGRDELPLRVGTGGSCQLRLPGPGGEPVALLDLLDELPSSSPWVGIHHYKSTIHLSTRVAG